MSVRESRKSTMSTKRKKDARISNVELKSLGLKEEDEPAVKSEKKKEKKSNKKSVDLKQSKILDFVEPAASSSGKIDVSFDGRMESFSWEELSLLGSFLQAKSALSKQQLALAVELWNTNPAPDVFRFMAGENEGRTATLAELHERDDKLEHVMFRELKKVFVTPAPAAPPSAPPSEPPRQHKKKWKTTMRSNNNKPRKDIMVLLLIFFISLQFFLVNPTSNGIIYWFWGLSNRHASNMRMQKLKEKVLEFLFFLEQKNKKTNRQTKQKNCFCFFAWIAWPRAGAYSS